MIRVIKRFVSYFSLRNGHGPSIYKNCVRRMLLSGLPIWQLGGASLSGAGRQN